MTTDDYFAVLDGHYYMSLTTFRKSGEKVSTPVWFAKQGSSLYVLSSPKAGKLKRIRNNAAVEVAPCTASGNVLGEKMAARARILPEGAEARRANQALQRKYGLRKRLNDTMSAILRFKWPQWIFLEITPA